MDPRFSGGIVRQWLGVFFAYERPKSWSVSVSACFRALNDRKQKQYLKTIVVCGLRNYAAYQSDTGSANRTTIEPLWKIRT